MADKILKKIKGFKKKYPFTYYLVGGQVRDQLLGIESCDFDFVVIGQSPKNLIDLGLIPVGKSFPVFLDPITKDEYALARKEVKKGRGHQEFEFIFDPSITLEDDLIRRDFTINTLCSDYEGNVFDFHDGLKDLENKKLKHVSNHFVEDPLRVLRAAKFCARLKFEIDSETINLMKKIVDSEEMGFLSKERIRMEFEDALSSNSFHLFIEVLKNIGYWDGFFDMFPSVYDLNLFNGTEFKWIYSGALYSKEDDLKFKKWQDKFMLPTDFVKKSKLVYFLIKINNQNKFFINDLIPILIYSQDGKNKAKVHEINLFVDQLNLIGNFSKLKTNLEKILHHFSELQWPQTTLNQNQAFELRKNWFHKINL